MCMYIFLDFIQHEPRSTANILAEVPPMWKSPEKGTTRLLQNEAMAQGDQYPTQNDGPEYWAA